MKSDSTRTYLIGAAFLAVLIAVVVLHAIGSDADGFLGRLEGMLAILLPAVMHSAADERRRKADRRSDVPDETSADDEDTNPNGE